MNLSVKHQLRSNNNQVKSTVGREVRLTAGAISQIRLGILPNLINTCQDLFDCLFKKGSTSNNALQFVPVLNEMAAIEQAAIEIFLKNPQTNHVLVENEFLKIVLIHWIPGKISSIHGHPKGGGVFKVISGSIEELRYTTDNTPKLLAVSAYHKGAVGYIDDQMAFHAVGNPNKESAISLHVYIRM